MASNFIIDGLEKLSELTTNVAKSRALMKDLLVRASKKYLLQSMLTSKSDYLSHRSGTSLGRVTSRLVNSLAGNIKENGEDILIRMGSPLEYAAIHEFGGPIISKSGRTVGHMPERSFIRRAFEDNTEDFVEDIMVLIQGAAQGGFNHG